MDTLPALIRLSIIFHPKGVICCLYTQIRHCLFSFPEITKTFSFTLPSLVCYFLQPYMFSTSISHYFASNPE